MFKSATRQRRADSTAFLHFIRSLAAKPTWLRGREAEHAASTSDRLMVRPDEFQEMPRADVSTPNLGRLAPRTIFRATTASSGRTTPCYCGHWPGCNRASFIGEAAT